MQSHYRPGEALRVPGEVEVHRFQANRHMKVTMLHTYHKGKGKAIPLQAYEAQMVMGDLGSQIM
jgi:hypothetical protein